MTGSDLPETDEPSEPRADTVLAGRFRIVERIGTGGMGSVWRAEQLGLGRHVAVKILKHELVKDAETVARFHREARATSLLAHTNTVRVFDFGETPDGSLFLAMELLEGELLTTRLQRQGGLGVEEAVEIVRQILRSLAEAHDHGIIHRDLKPDNVFLARVPGHPRPVVKVLDFGIAKVLHGDRIVDPLETQAGTVFGTPRYMSPEQARGKPLDARSDLYSVGIVLYQLLTGRAPFDDDDAVVVMARHIRERPVRPRELAPGRPIPASLEQVVMHAVEKDARKRFPSADAFEAALVDCLPDVRALDPPVAPTPVTPPLRSRRRRRVLAWSGAALAGIGAFAVGGAFGVFSDGEGSVVAWTGAAGAPPRSTRAPDEVVSTLVETRPPGAVATTKDGTRLGRTPVVLERPRGTRVELQLRLVGHVPKEVSLELDGTTKSYALTPLPERLDEPPVEPGLEAVEDAPRRRKLLPEEPYERFD